MKKLFAIAMIALVALSACKKIKPKNVDKTVTSGTWKVTLFSEDGINETSYFTGYVFTFNDGGSVSATNGSTTINGSWSTSEGSSDDSNKNAHFILSFPDLNHFDELSDDWHVTSLEDNKLELEDVSGGDGSIDLLTFQKN